ncbi:MAG: hypothetical protein ACI9TV_001550 [Sulfurimonas sp.]|uniref:hypothetical protein n=1 Tax=Sulfurimonas sp. TaxID=2022749 RepID=UPI0039E679D9
MFKILVLVCGLSSMLLSNSLADHLKELKGMVLVKESMIPGKDVVLPKETPLFVQQTVSMYNWINDGKGTKLNIYVPKEKVELYKTHGPYPDGLTAIAIYEDQGIVFVTEHFEGEPMYGTFDREGNDISKSHPSLNVATCYKCHEDYADICVNGTCSVPVIDTFKK